MYKLFWKFLLLTVLVLPITVNIVGFEGGKMIAFAEEDNLEGEDGEEASVESDEPATAEKESTDASTTEQPEKEDEEEEDKLKPSPDAESSILFVKPTSTDLPAGKLVRILVGLTNNGNRDFVVETIDAAFRYPQDYTYYIQNFTTVKYDAVVEPSKQMTFDYVFTPSDAFSSRPFGLTVNLKYKDSEGKLYQDAVFNETVTIVEPDEGLDGETFFLYVFLAAMVVLMVVGIQQLLISFGKKKRFIKPKREVVETGTQKADVDYDWIPEKHMKKSPGRSPKHSPRQRKRGNAENA